MASQYQHSTRTSYNSIKVTAHARQRGSERFAINSEAELKKIACAAKNKGVKIWLLKRETYASLGVSYDMYRYLKNHYAQYTSTQKCFYYKDKVFVFAGHSSHTLISVIPCTYEDMVKAIEKMDGRCYSQYRNEE